MLTVYSVQVEPVNKIESISIQFDSYTLAKGC